MDPSVLARKQLTELKGIASHLQMRGYQRLKKAELIEAIVRAAAGAPEQAPDAGNGSANGAVAVAERTEAPPRDPDGPARRPSAGGQLQLDAPATNGAPEPRDRGDEIPAAPAAGGTDAGPRAPLPAPAAGGDAVPVAPRDADGEAGAPAPRSAPDAGPLAARTPRDAGGDGGTGPLAARTPRDVDGDPQARPSAARVPRDAEARPLAPRATRDPEARPLAARAAGEADRDDQARDARAPQARGPAGDGNGRDPAADREAARRPARPIARGEDTARRLGGPARDGGDAAGRPVAPGRGEPAGAADAGEDDDARARTPGRSAGDEGRTRVRTRTRDRSGPDDAGRPDDDAPRPELAAPARNGRADTNGAAVDEPQVDGGRGESDDDDGEEFGGRRRRSRRERRRNKGQGPQGANGQAPPAAQGTRQVREDDTAAPAEPGEVRSGVLDILPEGYGFLRTSGYLPGDRDVYVSQSQVRRHGLRRGDVVEGPIRQQRTNEKVPALHHVETVNGTAPDPDTGSLAPRPDFKDMTPLFPDERLRLEIPDGPISMRIVDLIAPIGKGQRALIVSPPKAGKTTILKELGQAIAFNNPECHLMVVLVDERPEEVTDMQRSVPGEIIASTFDRPADDHTQIAELAIERAKRLVEQGQDVVILLDSITRLSRAYNLAAPASGRIMSGGVDSTALYPPKRFFGAARNIEHGGSLTIIATALIETGSKMDEVIFEEFKGTGNSEIRLDRKLEQKRVFPAIDIGASGTRKEELLLEREELAVIWKLRRVLHALDGPAALELLIDRMKQTRSNNQFLVMIQKSNLNTAGAHA